MSIDELKTLHNRATRGETLPAAEQARLNAWYASEDQLEDEALKQNSLSDASAGWREKTVETLAQLSVVTRQAQELAAQNEVLRQENNRLRQQLAQTPTTQVA